MPTFIEIRSAIRNTNSRIRSVLTKSWNHLQRFRVWVAKRMYQNLPRSLKRIVKKVGRIESMLHKKMLCLKPRLKRKYGRLVYPEGLTIKALVEQKQNFFQDFMSGSPDDDHIEFVEDCFADMERPKFGWRVKVTLIENEPCDFNPENPELNTCTLPSNHRNETNSDNAQRRQTLEQFRSAAPPDCRIRFVCDANNQLEATDLRSNDNTSIPTSSPTISSTLSPTPSAIISPTLPPTPSLSPTISPRPSTSPTMSPTSSPTLSPDLSTTQSILPLYTSSPTPLPHIYSYHVPKSKWDYTNFKPI